MWGGMQKLLTTATSLLFDGAFITPSLLVPQSLCPLSFHLVERRVEAAVVILQPAHGPIALQNLGRPVVLHAPVAAEHALLRPAVRTIPLALGHLHRADDRDSHMGRGTHVLHALAVDWGGGFSNRRLHRLWVWLRCVSAGRLNHTIPDVSVFALWTNKPRGK